MGKTYGYILNESVRGGGEKRYSLRLAKTHSNRIRCNRT